MSDGRVVISSEPSMGADEVAHRGFSSSFRGFDQNEVRAYLRKVGEELRVLRERERELRKSLDDARRTAAHPAPPDEATLMAVLGEEAGRVLQTAKEAASDIRAKAEENAGRLLREAEEKAARLLKESEERAARLRGEAETVMGERAEEAEKAAGGIRRAAEAEAGSIRAQAQAAAGEELEAAKARGREMVGEAHALRERVLADLVRRRSLARVQIEQLRAGRERLIEAYRVVRRTLDEATDELSVVEAEAKVAADSAARRAAAAPEGTVDELEADLTTARRAELPLVEPNSTWTPPPSAVVTPPPPAPVEAPPPVEATPPPPVEAPTPPPDEPMVRVLQAFDVGAIEDVSPPPLEVEPEVDAEAVGSRSRGSVQDLFARIKADRADAVARARAVLDELPDIAANGDEPSANGSVAISDVDESMLQRRDEMLAPVEEQLARKLKRVLQDEQNELLDRIRVTTGPLSGLARDAAAHASRYAEAATPPLLEAIRQGASFANPAAPCPEGLDQDAVPFASALAEEVAGPLNNRIADVLSDASHDADTPVAVDRLGAAFRQWKVEKIGVIARYHVVVAFSRGAFVASDDDRLRWVVDDDGVPCPDCDDNALAGPTPKGEQYPTGQTHPPAHPGCRCVLLPA
jgi:DivIVA domain-containing protein